MRLLGVELRRLTSRRLTLVSVLVTLAIVALLQLAVNAFLTPPDPAQARAQYAQAQKDWASTHQQYEQQCLASGGTAADCTIPAPTEADYGLVPPDFGDVVGPVLQSSGYLGGIAAFLFAASFIGAEFTSGAIGNWLSFVPRRIPVYLSKLGAVVIAAAVFGAGLAGVTLGAATIIAGAHGVTVTGLPSLFGLLGLSTAAVVVMAVIGYVVALIGRHTVVALGALMAYGVIAFIRAVLFIQATWAQNLSPWVPETNLAALIGNGTTYYVTVNDEPVARTISVGHGAIYLGVLVVALVIAGAVVFRRRDVN